MSLKSKATNHIGLAVVAAVVVLLISCCPNLLSMCAQPSAVVAAAHTCRLQPADQSWKGPCEGLGGENPILTVDHVKSIKTGAWRKGVNPSSVWSGKLVYKDDVQEIEIEIYDGGMGEMRTPDAWYPISKFIVSDKTLTFEIDPSREVPPNETDREIVQRAAQILSSESVWNRADNRKCPATETKWSIYCAMDQASIDVTGGFHHRRPALQIVRAIVEERTVGRTYQHRLMDYNNDPATKLDDVRTLFAEALTRISR